MLLGLFSLCFVTLVSAYPKSGNAVKVGFPDEVYQTPEKYFVPKVRTRRSIHLSGEGSNKQGYIRLEGEERLWEKGHNSIDGNGFGDWRWAEGKPQSSYGAGASGKFRVYEDQTNGRTLDVYGGYQRQWNTPTKDNSKIGAKFHFD